MFDKAYFDHELINFKTKLFFGFYSLFTVCKVVKWNWTKKKKSNKQTNNKAQSTNTPNKQQKPHIIHEGAAALCKTKHVKLQPLTAQCNSSSRKETNLCLTIRTQLFKEQYSSLEMKQHIKNEIKLFISYIIVLQIIIFCRKAHVSLCVYWIWNVKKSQN